jgi:hypothetical protein
MSAPLNRTTARLRIYQAAICHPDNNVEIDWMTDPKAELLTHELLRTEDCTNFLSIKNLRVTPPFVLDYAYADSTL